MEKVFADSGMIKGTLTFITKDAFLKTAFITFSEV